MLNYPIKLTRIFIKQFCENIEKGSRISGAIALSDVCMTTYNKWMKKAEMALDNNNLKAAIEDYPMEVELKQAVDKAFQRRKLKLVKVIDDTAKKNWHAAKWLLTKEHKDEFGEDSKTSNDVLIIKPTIRGHA